MKRYYNINKNEWYGEGQTITRQLSSSSIFSGIPTEE